MEFLSTGKGWGIKIRKKEILHYVNEKRKLNHRCIFEVGF